MKHIRVKVSDEKRCEFCNRKVEKFYKCPSCGFWIGDCCRDNAVCVYCGTTTENDLDQFDEVEKLFEAKRKESA